MTDRPIIFSAHMVRALLDGRKSQTRRLLTKSGLRFNGDRWPKSLNLYDMDLSGAYVDAGPSPAGNAGPYLKALWPYGRLIDGDDGPAAEWVMARLYPKVQPGDRLWVREGIAAEELSRPPQTRAATARERRLTGRTSVIVCDDDDGADGIRYLADDAWKIIPNTQEAGDAWLNVFRYGFKDDDLPSIGLECGGRGKDVPSIHMPRWASRLTLTVTEVRVQRVQAISERDARAEGLEFACDVGPQWRGSMNLPWRTVSPCHAFRDLWNSLHPEPGERWEDNPFVTAITFTVEQRNIDA